MMKTFLTITIILFLIQCLTVYAYPRPEDATQPSAGGEGGGGKLDVVFDKIPTVMPSQKTLFKGKDSVANKIKGKIPGLGGGGGGGGGFPGFPG